MNAQPSFVRLFPVGGEVIGQSENESVLAGLYAYPGAGRWVRANMISTIDGAVAGDDGKSGSINGPADFRVFEVLRALCDVVVVAGGTARAEGYRALRAPSRLHGLRASLGLTEHPTLVVVSGSGTGLDEVIAPREGVPAPFLITSARGAAAATVDTDRVIVVPDHDGALSATDVMGAVEGLNFRRILCEGGPQLLASLLDAGVVDEVCVTTAGAVFPGPAGRMSSSAHMSGGVPQRARLAHLLFGDDTLLARWVLAP
ncbi:dihydrofolate reductase family protein [Timonella sp. A28]|uniref:dihydrofolate reductase family protein n=1 Tax=Timonella sp. A28 TaxID=3442640 RepID=UPI003EBB1F33